MRQKSTSEIMLMYSLNTLWIFFPKKLSWVGPRFNALWKKKFKVRNFFQSPLPHCLLPGPKEKNDVFVPQGLRPFLVRIVWKGSNSDLDKTLPPRFKCPKMQKVCVICVICRYHTIEYCFNYVHAKFQVTWFHNVYIIVISITSV